MLITIENPQGIDKEIAKFQRELHDKLKALWDLTDADIKCYPRVYRNQHPDGKFVPENYEGGGEYKAVQFDEIAAYSFFGRADKSEFTTGAYTNNVYLALRVNLEKVKPLLQHRADEEVRLEVENIVFKGIYGFIFQSTETGIANAFREYPVWLSEVKFTDTHPWHVFRLNFQCRYSIQS